MSAQGQGAPCGARRHQLDSWRQANRRALLGRDRSNVRIFDAWSDEPWVIDGAAVRVSLVCFSPAEDSHAPGVRLDGEPVDEIHADLTAKRGGVGIDLTRAKRLPPNAGTAFMGDTKSGAFDMFRAIWRGSGCAFPPIRTVGPTPTFSSPGRTAWT